ncbi:MAG: pyridoxamine 5'-phosphate oxidase family protein [Nitrospirae bacterium]|nr:pyridoxamine 5'-phosphate oxidase family protein [Nitrospirota bacterium]MBI3351303.1 pyridoxamine 5'-phosphate oxidase family protein [Nitrospirota bacterium]
MAKIYEKIDDEMSAWIKQQRVFFVATAPIARDGHVNCSPKGGDSFKVIDPLTVVYQDLTGSGAETISHLRENSRIVVMFCAFEGPPRIVRLHGRGEAVTPGLPEYPFFVTFFPENSGTRAFIRVRISRISDSCGYAVPFFDYKGDRDALEKWARAKGADKLEAYRREKNLRSIDGLPAFDDIPKSFRPV